MNGCHRPASVLFLLFVIAALLPSASPANPDPCLVVYPGSDCVYHYDPTEYYTVTAGDPLYDPAYDRGGEVLLEVGTNQIDLSIYQAPNLVGFEMSAGGNDGYFLTEYTFDLIIDGWSNEPITYYNIYLVFEPTPSDCGPTITIDGSPLTGTQFPIGDLTVSTPTPDGNNYSDTITREISWSGGCYGILIWAYSDANGNGVHDGGECFTAFSHDTTIPAESSTWGGIKSLFD